MSHGVAYREMLMAHVKDRLEKWKTDPATAAHMQISWYQWKSERPNIDIRHGGNLTPDGRWKREYFSGKQKGVHNLPGWGGPRHFQAKVSYKGFLRTDVLEFLIKTYGYESYLEIGVDQKDNWKHIHCPIKDGVDPAGRCNYVMTSDEFFAIDNGTNYDLIFIDGLHQAEQVERDLENSLDRLNPGGTIVMHDCNPETEHEQRRERGPHGFWCGDVWKAFVKFRARKGLEMYVVNANNGIGVVRPGSQDPIIVNPRDMDYRELEKNRSQWLNLKTPGEFRKYETARRASAS